MWSETMGSHLRPTYHGARPGRGTWPRLGGATSDVRRRQSGAVISHAAPWRLPGLPTVDSRTGAGTSCLAAARPGPPVSNIVTPPSIHQNRFNPL